MGELVFLKMYSSCSDPDPPSARDVWFKTNEMFAVFISKKPLQLRFLRHQMPLTVWSVTIDSESEIQGVRKGMKLITIDGKSLSGMPYQKAFDCLHEAIRALPMSRCGE